LAGAASLLLAPAVGFAQAQPQTSPAAPPAATTPAEETVVAPPKRKAEEEITVTGSRIRRKDLTTPAPVTVLTRQQLQNSSVANVGDFLQMMPEQGNAPNTQVNNGGNGTTQINLRSLDPRRTLVLVDGKRFVFSGSGADATVDLNSIPTAAIERIEVLKDGASAIYGSDAIAGVVNIITRHRVNGTEVNGYGGASQHADGQVYDFNLLSGVSSDQGSIVFGAGYFDQHSFLASKRDWARTALNFNYQTGRETAAGSINVPQGVVLGLDPSPSIPGLTPGSPPILCPTTACSELFAKYGAGAKNFIFDPANPLSTPSGFRRFVSPADRYNYQALNFLVTPQQRISLFSNGEYRLHSNVRAYFQSTFVNRQSSNQLAPEPLNTNNFGITMSATNAFNPFGTDIAVGKRLVSGSPRSQAFEVDTFRIVTGIDGTLPDELGPLKGFFYDFSFNFGRSNTALTTNGSINVLATAAAIGPSFLDAARVAQCGTDAAHPVAACTPANLFGPANPTGAQLNALGFEQLVNRGFNQEAEVQANFNGELIPLLADRPMGIAAGYSYRREFGGFIPDAVAAQTFINSSGFPSFVDSDYGSAPTSGAYHVNEGYGELNVPVISGLPFVDDLEASAAFRAFKYSSFGSDVTYKFGIRYRPIRDVTLRGTYSTAFRAPSVLELFSGTAPSAEPATDPCAAQNNPTGTVLANCLAAGPLVANNPDLNTQIQATVGGSANLQPERARAWTVGVVLEPRMLPGFSLTADFYHIRITNLIIGGALTLNGYAQNYLDACYARGLASACSHIHRNNQGVVILVDDFNVNLGELVTSGLDIAARYTLPTEYGRFSLLFDSNILVKFNQNLFQLIKGEGNYDLGVNPRLKFNAGVNYTLGPLNVGVLGRYIGTFHECASGGGDNNGGKCFAGNPFPVHKIGQEITFDIFTSYLLRNPLGNTTISAGMRNALNTDPVRIYNSFLTYADPSAYDFVGRFFYGRISHAF
jgi:outer membrane receptor protein involved in Fe transport